MKSANRLIYLISAFLLIFVAVPLYLLKLSNEAIIVATMVVLYLFIAIQLDFFIRIAKALKWSKTGVILLGFFGIKNIFFGFYFFLVYFAGWIGDSWTVFIMPIVYVLYSIGIAKKLLELNPDEFESSSTS